MKSAIKDLNVTIREALVNLHSERTVVTPKAYIITLFMFRRSCYLLLNTAFIALYMEVKAMSVLKPIISTSIMKELPLLEKRVSLNTMLVNSHQKARVKAPNVFYNAFNNSIPELAFLTIEYPGKHSGGSFNMLFKAPKPNGLA